VCPTRASTTISIVVIEWLLEIISKRENPNLVRLLVPHTVHPIHKDDGITSQSQGPVGQQCSSNGLGHGLLLHIQSSCVSMTTNASHQHATGGCQIMVPLVGPANGHTWWHGCRGLDRCVPTHNCFVVGDPTAPCGGPHAQKACCSNCPWLLHLAAPLTCWGQDLFACKH